MAGKGEQQVQPGMTAVAADEPFDAVGWVAVAVDEQDVAVGEAYQVGGVLARLRDLNRCRPGAAAVGRPSAVQPLRTI